MNKASFMVRNDISTLSTECGAWRTHLRRFRDELSEILPQLEALASGNLARERLPDLEQLDNQVRLQLLNVHDLKQMIKEHERIAGWELAGANGISEAVWNKHETLYQQYQHLEHTITGLEDSFKQFSTNLL